MEIELIDYEKVDVKTQNNRKTTNEIKITSEITGEKKKKSAVLKEKKTIKDFYLINHINHAINVTSGALRITQAALQNTVSGKKYS